MRPLLVLALLSSTASADDVVLRMRSTSRAVTVDLLDGEQRCETPCELRVAPGAHRARIDGLDRTLVAGDRDADVIIHPTLRGRQITGIVLAAVASAGLTFAGHWSSPLDDRQRVAAGLLGAGALGFAVPFIRSASTLVGTRERPSRAEVTTGVQVVVRDGATRPVPVAGVGYRPRAAGFGADLRVRVTDADRYELAVGPTLHAPRIALVRAAIAARVGVASRRGPDVPADLATETPAMPGELALRALVEVEGRVQLEIPGLVQPAVGVTVQPVPDRQYAFDVGLHVPF